MLLKPGFCKLCVFFSYVRASLREDNGWFLGQFQGGRPLDSSD